MNDYKPNSHRFKEEKKEPVGDKKIPVVVSGKVKTKKKNDIRKFTDIFIAEDVSNVKSYIFMDVLVPAVKKAVSDIVRDGIDMILYGESGKRKSSSGSSYVSYGKYSDRRDDHRSVNDSRVKTRFDYEDLVFESRGEAEAVREQMDEMIDRYGIVTIADMYDMADMSAPYTSNKYGWTNIRTAEPIRIKEGYILKLPKAMPID